MPKWMLVCLCGLIAACGSLEERPASEDAPASVTSDQAADEACVVGTLTNEGIECPAMQTIRGDVYTLVGDLDGNEAGSLVCVCGAEADTSTCMQGTTLEVSRIGSPSLCP